MDSYPVSLLAGSQAYNPALYENARQSRSREASGFLTILFDTPRLNYELGGEFD